MSKATDVVPIGKIPNWLNQTRVRENPFPLLITTQSDEKTAFFQEGLQDVNAQVLRQKETLERKLDEVETEAQFKNDVCPSLSSLENQMRYWQMWHMLYVCARQGWLGGPLWGLRTKTQVRHVAKMMKHNERLQDLEWDSTKPPYQDKLKTAGITSRFDWRTFAEQVDDSPLTIDDVAVDVGKPPLPYGDPSRAEYDRTREYMERVGLTTNQQTLDDSESPSTDSTPSETDPYTDEPTTLVYVPDTPHPRANQLPHAVALANRTSGSMGSGLRDVCEGTALADSSREEEAGNVGMDDADAVEVVEAPAADVDGDAESSVDGDSEEGDEDSHINDLLSAVETDDADEDEAEDVGDEWDDSVRERHRDAIWTRITEAFSSIHRVSLKDFAEDAWENGYVNPWDELGELVDSDYAVKLYRNERGEAQDNRAENYVLDLNTGDVYLFPGIEGRAVHTEITKYWYGEFGANGWGHHRSALAWMDLTRDEIEEAEARYERLEALLERAHEAGMYNVYELYQDDHPGSGPPPSTERLDELEKRVVKAESDPEPEPYDLWEGDLPAGMDEDWWADLTTRCEGTYEGKVNQDPIAMIAGKKFFLCKWYHEDDEILAYELVPADRWETMPQEQKVSLHERCSKAGESIFVRSKQVGEPDTEYRIVEDVILFFKDEDATTDAIPGGDSLPDETVVTTADDLPDGEWMDVETTFTQPMAVQAVWPGLLDAALGVDRRHSTEEEIANAMQPPGKQRAYLALVMHFRMTWDEAMGSALIFPMFEGLANRGLLTPPDPDEDTFIRPLPPAVPSYHWTVEKYGNGLEDEVTELVEHVVHHRKSLVGEVADE